MRAMYFEKLVEVVKSSEYVKEGYIHDLWLVKFMKHQDSKSGVRRLVWF